jgi:uncharacterized protein YndB with AHSA1/START domain
MTSTTQTKTQMFRVYIRATPEAIWEAITTPEWTARYGYQAAATYDLRPGGAYTVAATEEMRSFGMAEVVVDGEVMEVDPPNRLVQTYRFKFMPDQIEEGFRTVTWDIHAEAGGVTRLTVTHDVTDAPIAESMITSDGDLGEGGGGWSWILSDLKSLLETGATMDGAS